VLILIVYRGPNKGQVFKLPGDQPRVLGRGVPPVGVSDSKVSTKHCRFTQRDGTWWLEDLKSRNGTYVNHVKLTQATELRDGDRVQLGETRIAVAMAQVSPSDSMVGVRAITAEQSDDQYANQYDPSTGIVMEGDDDAQEDAQDEHELIGAELDEQAHAHDEADELLAAPDHHAMDDWDSADASDAPSQSSRAGNAGSSSSASSPRGLALTGSGSRPVTPHTEPNAQQAQPAHARQSKLVAASAIMAALVALALGMFSVLRPQGLAGITGQAAPAAPAKSLAIDTKAITDQLNSAVTSSLDAALADRLARQSTAERETLQRILARLEALEPGQPIDTESLVNQLAAAIDHSNIATTQALQQLAAKQDAALVAAQKARDTAFTRDDLQNVLDGQTTLDARLAALTDQLETITDRQALADAVAAQVTQQVSGLSLNLSDDALASLRDQVTAAVNAGNLPDAIAARVDERLAAMTPKLQQGADALAQQPADDAPWQALSDTMTQLRAQVLTDTKTDEAITDALARLEAAQQQALASGETQQESLQASLSGLEKSLAAANRQQVDEQAVKQLEQRLAAAVTDALAGLATQDQVKVLAAQRVALTGRIDEAINRMTAIAGEQSEQSKQLASVASLLSDTDNDDRPALAAAVKQLNEITAQLGTLDQPQATALTEKIDQLLAQRALLEQVADQTRTAREPGITAEQVERIVAQQTTRLEARIAVLKTQLEQKPSAGELLAPLRQAIASAARQTDPRLESLIAKLEQRTEQDAATATTDTAAQDNQQVVSAVREIVAAQGASTEQLLKDLQTNLQGQGQADTQQLATTIQQALDRQASTSRAMLEELNLKLSEGASSEAIVAALDQALRDRSGKTQSLLEELLAQVQDIEQTRDQLDELVQASEAGKLQRSELQEMTQALQSLLREQGDTASSALSRIEQSTAASARDADAFATDISKDVAARLSRAVSLQLEAAALAGQDSNVQEVAPLLKQVLAELRSRDAAAAPAANPTQLDAMQLSQAMASVRQAAVGNLWQNSNNPRFDRMSRPRTSVNGNPGHPGYPGYTAHASPYVDRQAQNQYSAQGQMPSQNQYQASPQPAYTGNDGLTELQRAYRRAWVTNQPVVLSTGGFNAATGIYSEPRILDPVVARKAGINRWQDWYMADDFNERMKLRARVQQYRSREMNQDGSAGQAAPNRLSPQSNNTTRNGSNRNVTHIPPVPLPPAQ